MEQITVKIENSELTAKIFGSYDINARMLERAFGVSVRNRAEEEYDAVVIGGEASEDVEKVAEAVRYLKDMARYNDELSEQQVAYVIDMIKGGRREELASFGSDCICITTRGKPIKAKTVGQKKYVEAIAKNTVVFGIGPAVTGKTFLAVAMAV